MAKKTQPIDPVARLEFEIEQAGSVVALAKKSGISPGYISDVRTGRVEPGPLILELLGLRKIISYEECKS